MNLTKYDKQAIVAAIMAELPRVDEDALKKEIKNKLIAAMSPECQAVYAKTPDALITKYAYDIGVGYAVWFTTGDVTQDQFEEILKPYQESCRERRAIESKLEAAMATVRTRKQFIDKFPEFSQHAPSEHGKCTTLPAVANIVADLVKLGWEPKVTKFEGETS